MHTATEDEGLVAAREQYEKVAMVEPSLADQDLMVQAPAPEDVPDEQPATETPVEKASHTTLNPETQM